MQKYRTLITTQYLENYGAHSENGKFEDGNAYWKFKGGEQFIISMSGSDRAANAVAFLSAYLQKDNDSRYGKQLITSWESIGDVYIPENDWEKPIEIDVDEYFLERLITKKKKDDKQRAGERSPAGAMRASLDKAING